MIMTEISKADLIIKEKSMELESVVSKKSEEKKENRWTKYLFFGISSPGITPKLGQMVYSIKNLGVSL